ncbi:CLUMA_CG013928, isoform A [Clunio marinus]|uniref:CLUMA_CG013928, isoform A n=1 Tax=Clunio marinus TaxID=568069 RepID=A0A1J1IM77_9DIPT|nr:CLUMA_CG013928, isoform A [Clunio marinus]
MSRINTAERQKKMRKKVIACIRQQTRMKINEYKMNIYEVFLSCGLSLLRCQKSNLYFTFPLTGNGYRIEICIRHLQLYTEVANITDMRAKHYDMTLILLLMAKEYRMIDFDYKWWTEMCVDT